MARKKKEKKADVTVCVIDSETDPFKFGRKPMPFSWGFYDGLIYRDFWGDTLSNCTEQLIDYLISRKDPLVIYAHNGGKFDFFFLMEYGVIENPALIINGRIVKAKCLGIHELRDSIAIMPVALSKFKSKRVGQKSEIDYRKLEAECREEHKEEILAYQKQDCLVLHDYVMEFRERYGDKLTVGAMAIAELEKHHPVSRQGTSHDARFRPYYFGGRVQCFESGEIKARPGKKNKIYDINSSYPNSMKNFVHPYGDHYVTFGNDITPKFNKKTGKIKGFDSVYFMQFVGSNKGALPRRNPETNILEFDCEYGEFFACSHEIEAACNLGLITVDKIIEVKIPCSYNSFAEFVDAGMIDKVTGKANGDFAGELFAKFKLNSAYGKFGSNANEYKEFWIYDALGEDEDKQAFEEWRDKHDAVKGGKDSKVISRGAELVHDMGRFEVWQAPAPSDKGFFDVAVAASITSASRSVLLYAIHGATRPLYCDTDSLICEELNGVTIDEYALGAWKFEGQGDTIYIAGKKLYSMELDHHPGEKVKYKLASKGAKLTHDDIVRVCAGEIVHWQSDAPNFKFSGQTKFVSRNIRKII